MMNNDRQVMEPRGKDHGDGDSRINSIFKNEPSSENGDLSYEKVGQTHPRSSKNT